MLMRLLAGVGLIGVLVALSFFSSFRSPTMKSVNVEGVGVQQAQQQGVAEPVYRDEEILAKLVTDPVRSKFSPVFLYQVVGPKKGKFLGCGSYTTTKKGPVVVTAEHLFAVNRGDSMYAILKVQSGQKVATECLGTVVSRSRDLARAIGETPDVVIFQAADRPVTVRGSFAAPLDTAEETRWLEPADRVVEITSLVTGVKVPILGFVKSSRDGGARYMLIDYDSALGESGTGFVDADDKLYVLRGWLNFSEQDKQNARDILGTDKPVRMIYGPLNVE